VSGHPQNNIFYKYHSHFPAFFGFFKKINFPGQYFVSLKNKLFLQYTKNTTKTTNFNKTN